MNKLSLLYIVSIILGGTVSGLAAQISDAFPPTLDLRSPDLTIADAAPGPVTVLTYNPRGNMLAAAGSDNVIRVRDSSTGEKCTGELLRSFTGHTERILALAFSADGNTLVSFSHDKTVKTWDFATGKVLATANIEIDGEIFDAVFRSGGDPVLALADGDSVELINIQTGERINRITPFAGGVMGRFAFTPDGKLLVVTSSRGAIGLWDMKSDESLRTVTFPTTTGTTDEEIDNRVDSVALSDTHLLAGCSNGSVMLWSLDNLESVRVNKLHTGPVHSVAFISRGEQFASAGEDGVIRVWDTQTMEVLCEQNGPPGGVVSVAFSPNRQKMASGNADGVVCYWTNPLPLLSPDELQKIEAALPDKATAKPKKSQRILVFWRADAILHKTGVPAANYAIKRMGQRTDAYETDFSRDYAALSPDVLARYDAIVLNSTAHLVIPQSAKTALLDYVTNGGGVIGIHAAIDTFRDWPEGAAIVGATFGGHPWTPRGTWAVKLEEPDHPLLRAWGGKNFKMHDEFYEMGDPYTRADRRVLLTIDMSDPATAAVTPLHRKDRDFAISWIKHAGKGRVFYCVFGHIATPFQTPAALAYYLDGIQYALGDLDVDDTPRPVTTMGQNK